MPSISFDHPAVLVPLAVGAAIQAGCELGEKAIKGLKDLPGKAFTKLRGVSNPNLLKGAAKTAYNRKLAYLLLGTAIASCAIGVATLSTAVLINVNSTRIHEGAVNFLSHHLDANSTLGHFVNKNIIEFAPEDPGFLAQIGNAVAWLFSISD